MSDSAVQIRSVPRPEHPRPQMVRSTWLNLNGIWNFEIDRGDTGLERGLLNTDLNATILVPFAPESVASGVGDTDFMEAVWYRRTVDIPHEWDGLRPLLHFGAVDFEATVWVNGVEVVRHEGGFTPFTADLSDVAAAGQSATITVRARDHRYQIQARGKQALQYANSDCNYTRTTGIWQTVWLEGVPQVYLRRPRITPSLASGTVTIVAPLTNSRPGLSLRAVLTDADGEVASDRVSADLEMAPSLRLIIPKDRLRPWSPTDPHLYGLRLECLGPEGQIIDAFDSYTGLRSVSIDGKAMLINGNPLFQRLVLDQGLWPDTLMTAPTDEALIRDIQLAQEAGFNGARLHQKVFEERYLYHADRLGYLCWGEFADWGCNDIGPDWKDHDINGDNQKPTASYINEWVEAVERDYNHPSIIGWCPLNETKQLLHDRPTVLDEVTKAMFRATKLADPTRPVIDASGYSHRVIDTDVYDSHTYEQDPKVFVEMMSGLAKDQPYVNTNIRAILETGEQKVLPMSVPYRGQPYFVSEFGGIWWDPDHNELDGNDTTASWGYGQRVADEEEFQKRFAGLTGVLLDDPLMFGYCYTQLTDTFQEQNGIYRFDRTTKLDVNRIRAAQERPAAAASIRSGRTVVGVPVTLTQGIGRADDTHK